MSKFPVFFNNASSAAPSTSVATLGTPVSDAWATTTTNSLAYAGEDCVVHQIGVKFASAPGTGASYTFQLLKNGTAVGDPFVLAGTDTQVIMTFTSPLSFATGETISWRATPSTGVVPAALGAGGGFLVMECPATGNVLMFGVTDGGGTPVYCGLSKSLIPTTVEDDVSLVSPIAGQLKKLWVRYAGSLGATKTITANLRKNNADSAVPGCLLNDASLVVSQSGTEDFAPGDTLALQQIAVGSPTGRKLFFCVSIHPNVPNESILGFTGGGSSPGGGFNYFNRLQGANTNTVWGTTEASFSGTFFSPPDYPISASKLRARLTVAPGTGAQRTVAYRANGVNLLTTVIAGTDLAGAETATTIPFDGQGAVFYNRPGATAAATSKLHASIALTMTSGSTPTPQPPTNLVIPEVTGTPAVGQVLSVSNGTWSNTPTGYSRQWRRNSVAISGATATAYTVVSADAGATLDCVVVATNGTAPDGTATSNAVAVPAAPVNTVVPLVTTDGSPATGETITCNTGTWTGVGITYTYQWYRGSSPITGETANAYTLIVSDEGAGISCQVTATNGGGQATASSNSITPAVTAPISDASFLTYYSGGAGNTNPASSLGGARGGTYVGGLSTLFDLVPGSVALAGGNFYRVVYIRNTHATATAASGAAFVDQQFPAGSGLTLSVGVPTEAANTSVAPLDSGTTAPSGITFTSTTNPANGLPFGDLTHGSQRGLYVRLTVAPGAQATPEADAVFAVQAVAT